MQNSWLSRSFFVVFFFLPFWENWKSILLGGKPMTWLIALCRSAQGGGQNIWGRKVISTSSPRNRWRPHFVCDHRQGKGEGRTSSSPACVLGEWRSISLSLGRGLGLQKEERNKSQATLWALPNTDSSELRDPRQVTFPLGSSTFSSAKWGPSLSPAGLLWRQEARSDIRCSVPRSLPTGHIFLPKISRICELRPREKVWG